MIFLLPELDLVMVTTADNYDWNGPDVDALLVTRILPDLAPHLDARFNGAWYDPATDGQGLSLEILEERGQVVSFWYTYTDEGALQWFYLEGAVANGVGTVVVYEAEGGRFLQNDPVSLVSRGSGRFLPRDCNRVDFEVSLGEVETVIPLTRLSGHCYTPPGD